MTFVIHFQDVPYIELYSELKTCLFELTVSWLSINHTSIEWKYREEVYEKTSVKTGGKLGLCTFWEKSKEQLDLQIKQKCNLLQF